jgi:hypothetical protein
LQHGHDGPNDYLVMKPWSEWKKEFVAWLEAGDEDDKISNEEDDDEDDEMDINDILAKNWANDDDTFDSKSDSGTTLDEEED